MTNAPRTWSPSKKFVPHYVAEFTPEQLQRFNEQDYKVVDSRSIKNMMIKVGIEVKIVEPMNQGLVILITKDGFYERTSGNEMDASVEWGTPEHSHVVAYKKSDREFASISIMTGISKLGFVFKMQKDDKKPNEPARMFAF